MCYGQLADLSRKMEKYDFLGGHKLAQDIFKNDSENVEGIGRALGWRELEQQAQWNKQNPEEGMAHAGVATLGGWLGGALGNYLGSGSQSTGYVDQIGNAAEGAAAGSSLGAAGGLMGTGMNTQKAMQMMQMMKAMEQQPQPQGMMAPPRQGQIAELSMDKGFTPGNNSFGTGMPKDERYMTEEEKRKRRMMRGY